MTWGLIPNQNTSGTPQDNRRTAGGLQPAQQQNPVPATTYNPVLDPFDDPEDMTAPTQVVNVEHHSSDVDDLWYVTLPAPWHVVPVRVGNRDGLYFN